MTLEGRYKITGKLGDGSFGCVYKAISYADQSLVAIKKMKNKYSSWEECLNLREVKSLRQFSNHVNIVKLKEVIREKDGTLFLIFEYMEGNLYQYMKNQGDAPLSEHQVKSMMYQILLGLSHMHKYGFFHRDMKPENLLTRHNIVKIADFGLAREIRSLPPYTEYVSTRWYRAPEIILHSNKYSSPVDIWAVGCIFAELLNLKPLFAGTGEIDQLIKICSVLGPPQLSNGIDNSTTNSKKNYSAAKHSQKKQAIFAGGVWNDGHRLASRLGLKFTSSMPIPLYQLIPRASVEALELIADMLQFDPAKRPTAQECLNHGYFANVVAPQDNLSNLADPHSSMSPDFELISHDKSRSTKSHGQPHLTQKSLVGSSDAEWDSLDFDLDKALQEITTTQPQSIQKSLFHLTETDKRVNSRSKSFLKPHASFIKPQPTSLDTLTNELNSEIDSLLDEIDDSIEIPTSNKDFCQLKKELMQSSHILKAHESSLLGTTTPRAPFTDHSTANSKPFGAAFVGFIKKNSRKFSSSKQSLINSTDFKSKTSEDIALRGNKINGEKLKPALNSFHPHNTLQNDQNHISSNRSTWSSFKSQKNSTKPSLSPLSKLQLESQRLPDLLKTKRK